MWLLAKKGRQLSLASLFCVVGKRARGDNTLFERAKAGVNFVNGNAKLPAMR